MQSKNFINGEFIEAADSGIDTVMNPASGEPIIEVASSTAALIGRL